MKNGDTHADVVHELTETMAGTLADVRKTITFRAVNWLEATLDAIARNPRKTVDVRAAKWLRTQIIDENQKLHISPTTWALLVATVLIWGVGVPYTFYVVFTS